MLEIIWIWLWVTFHTHRQRTEKRTLSLADPGFPRRGKNLLFGKVFAENWMKIKEIGPRGGEARPWRPLESANDSLWSLLELNALNLSSYLQNGNCCRPISRRATGCRRCYGDKWERGCGWSCVSYGTRWPRSWSGRLVAFLWIQASAVYEN